MEVVLTYSLQESGFRLHISFHSHATFPRLFVLHTHPHTHAQTAVIVRSGEILEGSSLCVLITAGGTVSSIADSHLQSPQFHPEIRSQSV